MTQDDADYAVVHLQRAITLLQEHGPPRAVQARAEIERALALIQSVPFNPYADTAIRPGLNKPTEDSADV